MRRPALHFVVLGAMLYAAKAVVFGAGAAAPGAEPIVIDSGRVAELRDDWRQRTGAEPDERALSALIRSEIDDRLLIHEARRRGLHRSDAIVQRRLLRNMSFVGEDEDRSARDRLDEAYRLGMDRSDLVVRRRLIQLIQLEAYGRARTPAPGEVELEAYLEQHADRFVRPERMRLEHIYFSRDARGEATAADARAALARLPASPNSSELSDELGDPFMFPRDLRSRSERDLARTFGAEFAEGVFALPEGSWQGPVASAYGEHLVLVHERTPAALPPLDVVRSEVRESLLAERGEQALRERLRSLRESVPVRVEGLELPPAEGE